MSRQPRDPRLTCEETSMVECCLCAFHGKCEREGTLTPPKPYLELDEENWCWTLKGTAPVVHNDIQYHKRIRFHAFERECPVCGITTKVVTRNFQPAEMQSIEDLACGHHLLIYRTVKGLKKVGLDPAKAKNWIHGGWIFRFLEKHEADAVTVS